MVAAFASGAPASAAPVSYESRAWVGCEGGYNSGSFDDAGRTYIPCGSPTTIGIYDPGGALVDRVELDVFATDVAPTADGASIYVATTGAPFRLTKGATGSWARDSWKPAPYSMNGSSYSAGGLFVATDAAGNAYFADGAWAPNQNHTVVKYDSNGNVVTRFGSYQQSWATGSFYWMLTGLAVSADGSTVYTAEVGNNRIQTWRRQLNGTYAASSSFGGTSANNADRGGYCNFTAWQGAFAAPYDVALDGAGNVYVINTTCKQLLRFTPGFGELTANIDIRVNGADYPRPHGFAVSRTGVVFVGENQRVLVPTGVAVVVAPPPVRGAPIPTSTPAAHAPPAASAPAPSAPPAQAAAQPVLGNSPQAALTRSPLRLASTFGPRALVGPRAARRLMTRVKCSRACTVRVLVRDRGGTAGFATRRGAAGQYVTITVPLGRKRTPGRSIVTFSAHTTTGDSASAKRIVFLGA